MRETTCNEEGEFKQVPLVHVSAQQPRGPQNCFRIDGWTDGRDSMRQISAGSTKDDNKIRTCTFWDPRVHDVDVMFALEVRIHLYCSQRAPPVLPWSHILLIDL